MYALDNDYIPGSGNDVDYDSDSILRKLKARKHVQKKRKQYTDVEMTVGKQDWSSSNETPFRLGHAYDVYSEYVS